MIGLTDDFVDFLGRDLITRLDNYGGNCCGSFGVIGLDSSERAIRREDEPIAPEYY